ncbi:MAG TPA: GYD domain-containing protein [Acidobacteriaceae bacterium]|jgi:uncharacterized protein with GYD domain|nr:GYD domain-containing protein [Acidobacteriaceae bacterium]
MATYISLLKFTQKGMEAIRESPARLAAAAKVFEEHGGSLKNAWYTMGQYDIVVVAEFPSDEVATSAMLATVSRGNVQGETLRGFTAQEFQKLLS